MLGRQRNSVAAGDCLQAAIGNDGVSADDNLERKIFSYVNCVCLIGGAARIFTAIPLFYLSHNKSTISRVTPSQWERESAPGWGTVEVRSTNYFFRIENIR